MRAPMTTAPEPADTPPSSFSHRAVHLALVLGLCAQLAALFSLIVLAKSLPVLAQNEWGTVLGVTILSFLVTLGTILKLRNRNSDAVKIIGGGQVRLFLYLALAGAIVQTFSIEVFDLVWAQVFIGTAIAIGAILTLLSADLVRYIPRALIRSTDVLVFSLAVLLVGGELGLRLLAKIKPSPIYVRACDSAAQLLAAHHYPAGVLRWGFPTNSLGHYDDEFVYAEGKHNVLVIGDSFSSGIVPHYHHYTTVAERALPSANLWNLGQPKTGPDGYRLQLETEGLALRPDAIVISIYLGNDLIESENIGDPPSLYESCFGKENMLLYLVPDRISRVMEEQERLGDHVIGGNQDETRIEHLVTGPAEIAAAFPWTEDPALELASFSKEQYARIEAERVRQNHFAPALGLHEKLMTAVLEMKAMAGDIPFFVMLIPDEYQIDDEVWETAKAANSDSLLDRDQPQKMIIESCEQRGIPCLDLLPALRASKPLPNGKPGLYHLQNTHLNTRGNLVAGTALAAFLKQELRN